MNEHIDKALAFLVYVCILVFVLFIGTQIISIHPVIMLIVSVLAGWYFPDVYRYANKKITGLRIRK